MSRGSKVPNKSKEESKSPPREETELRFVNYEEEEEAVEGIDRDQIRKRKTGPSNSGRSDNEVGLSLEVEIDESLRDLLSTQPNDFSDLLDVTIIQQTNSRQQTKINVDYNEVSEFIEMLNQHNGQDNFCSKLRSSSHSKANRTQHFADSFAGKEFFDSENRTDTEEPSLVQDKTTVYTTPYTFNNIKKNLPCLNPHQAEEKPGTPCLCQHCGMVGVLVESQKRPAIPHTPNPKFNPPKKSQQASSKYESARSKSKSETNLLLLKELSQKIMALENRLLQQEESSVRKDYFKYVIHKLLSQYSSKLDREVKTVNIATQYSKTTTKDERYKPKNRNYHAHNLKIDNSDESCYSDSSLLRKKRTEKRRTSRSRNEDGSNTINDLRSKITNLIEEKIKAPKKSNKRDLKTEKHNEILKLPPNMDDIKVFDNKAVYSSREATVSPFRKQNRLEEKMSSQTIKQLCDLVYSKYQERHSAKTVDDSTFRRNIEAHKKCLNVRDVPEKLLGRSGLEGGKPGSPQERRKDNLDVSYVNPAVKAWQDESTEGEFEWNRRGKKTKHTIQEKIKYLKLLARKKNVDETELWNNILNQAKKHIKSNEDTVSIQLPCGLSNRDISELELTLSNLKEIVKKSRNVKKKSSCLSIELNYKTSSDNYIMKRNVRKCNKNKVKGVK